MNFGSEKETLIGQPDSHFSKISGAAPRAFSLARLSASPLGNLSTWCLIELTKSASLISSILDKGGTRIGIIAERRYARQRRNMVGTLAPKRGGGGRGKRRA